MKDTKVEALLNKRYAETFGKEELTNAFNQTVLGREIPKDFKNEMSTLTGQDGGYLVPEDLKGDIEAAKKMIKPVSQYVDVIPVKTVKGRYTTEGESNYAELNEITSDTQITEQSLKLNAVNWDLRKFGSFTSLSEELYNDSEFNLIKFFANTHVEKAAKTENKIIFEAVKTALTPKVLTNASALETSLNKDLNPALEKEIVVVTNQDGLELLTHKTFEINGVVKRYLDVYPVEVYPNDELPTVIDATNGDRAPFIYGSLKRGVKLFTDDEVGVLFVKNPFGLQDPRHVLRGIERIDVKVVPGTTQLIYAEMPLV